MNRVFEFTVAHETHSYGRCSRELDVDCKISALDQVKMVGGPTYARTEVSTIEVKPLTNSYLNDGFPAGMMKHLHSTRITG